MNSVNENADTGHTFELVRFFISNQSDASDAEVFEDDVDVTLHGVEGQVSHVRGIRRLGGQLLLLAGSSRAAATAGSSIRKGLPSERRRRPGHNHTQKPSTWTRAPRMLSGQRREMRL